MPPTASTAASSTPVRSPPTGLRVWSSIGTRPTRTSPTSSRWRPMRRSTKPSSLTVRSPGAADFHDRGEAAVGARVGHPHRRCARPLADVEHRRRRPERSDAALGEVGDLQSDRRRGCAQRRADRRRAGLLGEERDHASLQRAEGVGDVRGERDLEHACGGVDDGEADGVADPPRQRAAGAAEHLPPPGRRAGRPNAGTRYRVPVCQHGERGRRPATSPTRTSTTHVVRPRRSTDPVTSISGPVGGRVSVSRRGPRVATRSGLAASDARLPDTASTSVASTPAVVAAPGGGELGRGAPSTRWPCRRRGRRSRIRGRAARARAGG